MLPTTLPSVPLSLAAYLQILRRRRRLVGLVTLLTTVFALVPTILGDPVYTSVAEVQVSSLTSEGVFASTNGVDVFQADQARVVETEVQIIKSIPIEQTVLEQFPSRPDFDGPDVAAVGFSNIVEIKIHSGSPEISADVANAFADAFVADRRQRTVDALVGKAKELREQSAAATTRLEEVDAQLADPNLSASDAAVLGPRRTALSLQIQDYDTRADEFDVEASLRGRGTQVISPAQLDKSPSEPNPWRDAILGLVLGFLLAIAIAVVIDTAQDRLGSRDDLAAIRPGVPVLTSVPHADMTTAAGRGDFALREAYRYLRTGIRVFGLNSTLSSVLVTSAVGGEGKTTTATNLALAMAEAGDRVVLIDCDLRRPRVHEHFGLANDLGLTSIVVGDVPLDDVTHFVSDNLAVVPAGPPVHNPIEVLGSHQFAVVLRSIVSQADFTIIDAPPVLPLADALVLGQQVDGAVVVSRLGGVKRRAVRELLYRLDEAQISLVGLVANDDEQEPIDRYYNTTTTASDRS